MEQNLYLQWLARETPTAWWHDSADPREIAVALKNGAVGITTNPLLIKQALSGPEQPWRELLREVPDSLKGDERAEEIIRRVTVKIAETMLPRFQADGNEGYVCAQVNPKAQADREAMLAMARRLHRWAPNIAVKLPATAAGLDVLEECAAEGITVTATVSFSVPQAVAAAERYRKGLQRAAATDGKTGKCFAVIMVGRVDDYLLDAAHDSRAAVRDSDIRQAGVAMVKHAAAIFKAQKYEAILMPSGVRSAAHVEALAGGDMALSIHPKIQKMLAELTPPFMPQIDVAVEREILARLLTMHEFRRAYEADGMNAEEFLALGSVQRTLSQFVDAGWGNIEAYGV